MNSIFLSYSKRDYFFAEMLALKLGEKDFTVWRDQGSIRAGDDWRQSIEDGIKDCLAVIVALSANSAESAYVTYEWAYAIGMSKPVIPVKLSDCTMHPKLEPTQYIDFSYPKALPWDELIQRLKDIEVEKDSTKEKTSTSTRTAKATPEAEEATNAILEYLNTRGFTMVSFERLRQRIDLKLTERQFQDLIKKNSNLFRPAMLKGGKPGIAKRVP